MKCASCYADNTALAQICVQCGESVRPILVCPAGHVLPDGEPECAVCPGLWPELTEFEGPPVLRGVLWVIEGSMLAAAGSSAVAEPVVAVELRDDAAPLNLRLHDEATLQLLEEDDPRADAKILVRPEGVGVCLSPRLQLLTAADLQYSPLRARCTFGLKNALLGVGLFEVPEWVDEPPAG